MLVERGPLAWLRRRDPGGRTLPRALRTTLVACLAFYLGRFVLDNAALATYGLFGVIALGALAQLPGGARRRAGTLLVAAPVGAVLVVAGSLLARNTWAAVAGMALVGFAVSYAGAGGPVVVGMANGLQLLYILPCFPPYEPGQLSSRLLGLALGVGLLVLAELLVLPEPEVPGYQERLATALDQLTGCVPAGGALLPAAFASAASAAEELRPSRVPAQSRPASATHRDQALSQAATALRFALARLTERNQLGPATERLPELTPLAGASAAALRGGPPPEPAALAEAAHALHLAPLPATVTAARQRALLLAAADGVWTVGNAVRVVVGAPVHLSGRGDVAERFEYAHRSALRLVAHRLAAHLTPRSVYFQSAVRVGLALAAARLIAGGLGLSHGFWVLLATLTVLRSRATDTRTALRPAILGTLLGALLMGAVLLTVGGHIRVYEVALPLVMFTAFAAGPLLGQVWAQAGFTVTVGTVFAQLAPANWRLAEARVLDVLAGAVVGVLAGVCAWPRGGAGELRRDGARLLARAGAAVTETAAVTAGAAAPSLTALRRTSGDLKLAEASYAMYQSECPDPRMSTVDWQALVMAGHHIVNGGQALRTEREPCSQLVQGRASTVAAVATALIALVRSGAARPAPDPAPLADDRLRAGQPGEPDGRGPGEPDGGGPGEPDGAGARRPGGAGSVPATGVEELADADVLVWLDGVAADLARVPARPAPAQSASDRP